MQSHEMHIRMYEDRTDHAGWYPARLGADARLSCLALQPSVTPSKTAKVIVIRSHTSAGMGAVELASGVLYHYHF